MDFTKFNTDFILCEFLADQTKLFISQFQQTCCDSWTEIILQQVQTHSALILLKQALYL